MKVSRSLRAEFAEAIPKLRAFAISLCGDRVKADDLVQEALTTGWAKLYLFEEGTDLPAWLCTILRNRFYSECRKRRLEVEDPDDGLAAKLWSRATQDAHMELQDFQIALRQIPAHQREAILLICALGMSYDEAAQVCGCAPGTIKSRVNRARSGLADLLQVERRDGSGPAPILERHELHHAAVMRVEG